MLAYDKHMNFVLAETEEFRTVKVGWMCTTVVKRLTIPGQEDKGHAFG